MAKTKYEVSYDLRVPGRNYDTLYMRLAAWQAVRALKSVWIIEADSTTAAAIRDDLAKYIDSNDGLLVCTMTGEAAWQKLEGNSDAFLLGKRAA
jgi:CRISPR/Cas system-associated endoribonuclease Cas2